MSAVNFPFAALVGLEPLKLALQLAAIDHRLSLLVRGDKGAGKSTAARALRDLLSSQAPFMNFPIGATEDRVLGGLDVERALRGEPALKPGILAEANGGVLYVDEVNLLPDHLADAMLDAVASGVHVVEREGFSAEQHARFVLIGTMNPEEGSLRPQLLDRFALVVDVSAPMEPDARRETVERRLAFDADPSAFAERWQVDQRQLAQHLRAAQQFLQAVTIERDLLALVSERVCEAGVRSLRADLAVVRASRAMAALTGSATVTAEHVETVLPFALQHRASHRMPPPPPQAPLPPAQGPQSDRRREDADAAPDRIFNPVPVAAPTLVVDSSRKGVGRGSARHGVQGRGVAIGSRMFDDNGDVDLRASLVHAVASTGSPQPRREDLQEKRRAPGTRQRFVFVVDSSGSQAARRRMELVKGTVLGLLDSSLRRHDEVAVVLCRGAEASVALLPTSNADEARRTLAFVATGGRTPLADGLERAAGLLTENAALILLTDGRANVPNRTDDPWEDALQAASAITCPALVIDSEDGPNPTGRAALLADRMRAQCVSLDAIDSDRLLSLVRPLPQQFA